MLGLFAAALWAFAETQKLRAGWLFLVPALLPAFAVLPAWPARLRAGADAALRILLLVSFVFGLAWTLYPVLPQAIFDLGPRVLGLALAGFAAAFFLPRGGDSAARGVIPASLGLLAVGMLSGEGRAPLLPPGLATLALAVHAGLDAPTLLPRGVSSGVASRLAKSSALLAVGALISLGLVRLLPWAQPLVERATAGWIDSGASSPRSAVGSDSATLGRLEEVALSRRVVMRVHATQPQKLRVRVLTRFDGHAWHASKSEARRLAALSGTVLTDVPGFLWGVPGATPAEARAEGALLSLVVLAQPDAAALAAPRGTRLVQLAGSTSIDSQGVLAAPQPPVELYGLVNRRSQREAAIPERAALLELPTDTDPRLVGLADQLSAGAPQRLRVQRTLNHLDRECRYALGVGAFRSTQPVAEFLFEKKRGYCEYFASAAALLLRLQGIPTRYVTGWNVTEERAAFGHFVVRESDAHAWIEAYVDGEGWIELDPTPAAQYAEVHGRQEGGWRKVVEAVAAATRELWIRLCAGDHGRLSRWIAQRAWPAFTIAGLALLIRIWRKKRRAAAHAVAPPDALPADARGLVATLDALFARIGQPRPASRGLLEHEGSLAEDALPQALRDSVREAIAWVYARGFGRAPEDAARIAVLRQRLNR